MSKVIFLDCDGVVSTRRVFLALQPNDPQWTMWDVIATAAIKRVCKNKGWTIVISSTWRYGDPDLLAQRLKEHGLIVHLEKDGCTADFMRHNPEAIRGDEIKDWLTRHHETTDYIILDDIDQFYPDQQSHFIQTHENDGMSSKNILKLFRKTGVLKS